MGEIERWGGRGREEEREWMATERVERGLFALGKVLQIPSLEADVLVEPEGKRLDKSWCLVCQL